MMLHRKGLQKFLHSSKRGQLTLFVVLGVVIVIAIVAYYYISQNYTGDAHLDPKVATLRDTVLDCFKNNYEESLTSIGFQGGYLIVPDPKEEISYIYIKVNSPYYYYKGESYVPSMTTIQSNVIELTEIGVIDCLEEAQTNNAFTSISFSPSSTIVLLSPNEALFTTRTIMTVHYDNKTSTVDFANYQQNVPSKLYQMRELAAFIVTRLQENNEWMPYADVVTLAQESDVSVSINDFSDGSGSSVVISVYDDFYPETYSFLNKYKDTPDLGDIDPLL